MFWRKWFAAKRRQNGRTVLERQRMWGATPQTLEWLLEELLCGDLDTYRVTRGETIPIKTTVDNVDVLLQRLQRAVVIIQEIDDVDVVQIPPEYVTTLDRFLVTVRNQPIAPTEVVKTLTPLLREFVTQMLMLLAEEHTHYGYYCRRYERLMLDLKNMLEALIAASD